jgi:hypothetical protein
VTSPDHKTGGGTSAPVASIQASSPVEHRDGLRRAARRRGQPVCLCVKTDLAQELLTRTCGRDTRLIGKVRYGPFETRPISISVLWP